MRSISKVPVVLAIAVGSLAAPSWAQAQDLEGCDEIDGFVAAGDYGQALVELGWCERTISELHFQKILDILGVTILGYEPGDGTVEAVMGFSTIEITHSDGATQVRTTFASGIGGMQSPMAGLGALAGLASAFGVREPGVEQVRIGRNTGRLTEQSDGGYSLMVTLAGGQILTQEGPDGDLLQEFAAQTISMLEEYLGR